MFPKKTAAQELEETIRSFSDPLGISGLTAMQSALADVRDLTGISGIVSSLSIADSFKDLAGSSRLTSAEAFVESVKGLGVTGSLLSSQALIDDITTLAGHRPIHGGLSGIFSTPLADLSYTPSVTRQLQDVLAAMSTTTSAVVPGNGLREIIDALQVGSIGHHVTNRVLADIRVALDFGILAQHSFIQQFTLEPSPVACRTLPLLAQLADLALGRPVVDESDADTTTESVDAVVPSALDTVDTGRIVAVLNDWLARIERTLAQQQKPQDGKTLANFINLLGILGFILSVWQVVLAYKDPDWVKALLARFVEQQADDNDVRKRLERIEEINSKLRDDNKFHDEIERLSAKIDKQARILNQAVAPSLGRVSTHARAKERPSSAAALVGVLQPGQTVLLLERRKKWYRIAFVSRQGDRREGWVPSRAVTSTTATITPRNDE